MTEKEIDDILSADVITIRGAQFVRREVAIDILVKWGDKQRNKAIDEVLNVLDKMMYAKFDRSEIEALKTSSSLTEDKSKEK